MQTISPGDRVIAINTDPSRPICAPPELLGSHFSFPDGPLREGTLYHVAAAHPCLDGNQCLLITGLRVILNSQPIPWNSSRFRKIDSTSHPRKAKATKTRRKTTAPARKQPLTLAGSP